ncbi:glycosyltransferase family 57 protein [Naematelia encephala]|uniref:Alpha-1,3-glucosyltransferase n=1 Tax=Naematelia encephala TaxID=71784 RepID=A0A1Y2B0B6_9TREE|nr:glycosyltransferase family 57 protein [Naematelia encephala]
MGLSKGERDLIVVSTILKVLLFPAYRSTDFEVHRNWLAITRNLPLKEWYQDTTSEWTLDYPPFFAYFSYLLSIPARLLLPHKYSEHILRLSEKAVEGWDVTGYMRLSVLISEIVLFTAVLRLSKSSSNGSSTRLVSLAIALHPGFIILDSIHFQYNGFLFGIMLWSLIGAKENRPIVCAAFFAALLNFKHIYIYLAPAWFIYLLRQYCIPPGTGLTLHLKPLVQIGSATLAVFAVSLGPFLYLNQGTQLLARLFPFTRGLMHAYWAPNAWASVTLLDRILLQIAKHPHLELPVSSTGVASTSRGLVGDTYFAVLPNITPLHCFLLTGITQFVQLIPLWRQPSYKTFLQAIAACGFSSFMFGWHVHEKAVMLVLVPLSLLSSEDWNHFQAFVIASVSGLIGLFPLLFNAAETPVKMGYSLIWLVIVCTRLRQGASKPTPTLASHIVDTAQNVYLASAIPLLIFTSILHPSFTLSGRISARYEFLPLMMTSVWCSIGLWVAWGRLVVGMWLDLPHQGGLKID